MSSFIKHLIDDNPREVAGKRIGNITPSKVSGITIRTANGGSIEITGGDLENQLKNGEELDVGMYSMLTDKNINSLVIRSGERMIRDMVIDKNKVRSTILRHDLKIDGRPGLQYMLESDGTLSTKKKVKLIKDGNLKVNGIPATDWLENHINEQIAKGTTRGFKIAEFYTSRYGEALAPNKHLNLLKKYSLALLIKDNELTKDAFFQQIKSGQYQDVLDSNLVTRLFAGPLSNLQAQEEFYKLAVRNNINIDGKSAIEYIFDQDQSIDKVKTTNLLIEINDDMRQELREQRSQTFGSYTVEGEVGYDENPVTDLIKDKGEFREKFATFVGGNIASRHGVLNSNAVAAAKLVLDKAQLTKFYNDNITKSVQKRGSSSPMLFEAIAEAADEKEMRGFLSEYLKTGNSVPWNKLNHNLLMKSIVAKNPELANDLKDELLKDVKEKRVENITEFQLSLCKDPKDLNKLYNNALNFGAKIKGIPTPQYITQEVNATKGIQTYKRAIKNDWKLDGKPALEYALTNDHEKIQPYKIELLQYAIAEKGADHVMSILSDEVKDQMLAEVISKYLDPNTATKDKESLKEIHASLTQGKQLLGKDSALGQLVADPEKAAKYLREARNDAGKDGIDLSQPQKALDTSSVVKNCDLDVLDGLFKTSQLLADTSQTMDTGMSGAEIAACCIVIGLIYQLWKYFAEKIESGQKKEQVSNVMEELAEHVKPQQTVLDERERAVEGRQQDGQGQEKSRETQGSKWIDKVGKHQKEQLGSFVERLGQVHAAQHKSGKSA